MRWLTTTTALIALLLLSGTAAGEVDFLDQALTVDLVSDPTEVTITASVEVAVTTDTNSIRLFAGVAPFDSLEWDGTPLTLTDRGWYVSAALPSTASAGTEGTLTAVMSGEVSCPYPGGYVTCLRSADLTYLMPPWDAGAWYLMNAEGDALDTHTGRIEIILPSGHKAAAMGVVPAVTDNGDGTASWVFELDREVAQLAFIAGAFDEVVAVSEGFEVRGLYYGDATARELMSGLVDEASLVAPLFAEWWGAPPVEEIDYATFSGNTPFAGTSIGGLILLHELIFTPRYQYLIVAVSHELAHLWWGTMASATQARDHGFFAESMAEYAMLRARGALEGEPARDAGSRMNAVWYMYGRPSPTSDTPVLSQVGSEIAIFAIYHKGSTVLRTFEEAAGVDGIDAGLRAMIEAGPGGATIPGFLAAIEDESGVDLTSYVETWLLGQGYPVVLVSPYLSETADGYQVTLSAAGDDFPMLLPVVVSAADGSAVDATLDYEDGVGETVVEVAQWPATVRIDPGWTAVRELVPATEGDVSFDGRVDGADLVEVALRYGTALPSERRVDGGYDPLYDLNGDFVVDDLDLDAVISSAAE